LVAPVSKIDFLDEPPEGTTVTTYDRKHTKLYLRLLDAATEGADWRDVTRVIFGLEAEREPARARHVHDSHLARARWMTTEGYLRLLKHGR
jgi:hypothetical protein